MIYSFLLTRPLRGVTKNKLRYYSSSSGTFSSFFCLESMSANIFVSAGKSFSNGFCVCREIIFERNNRRTVVDQTVAERLIRDMFQQLL